MRRIPMGLALLMLLTAAPAASAPMDVRHDQSVFAMWLVPTNEKNEYKAFYADAELGQTAEGVKRDHASIGKGHCSVETTKDFTSVGCMLESLVVGTASGHFEMDPLM